MTLGDIVAQITVDGKKATELDLKRTLRFTILGSCVVVSWKMIHFLSLIFSKFLIIPFFTGSFN